MTRRRQVIIRILAVVVCGVWLTVVFWPEKEMPEPVYEGKKLSEWVMEQTSFGMLSAPAQEAVLAIGTNGICFYLDWLPDRRSKVSRAVRNMWWKVESLCGVQMIGSGSERQEGALLALESLGRRAAEAVPALENLATNSPSSETRERAYFCLLIVGEGRAKQQLLSSPDHSFGPVGRETPLPVPSPPEGGAGVG